MNENASSLLEWSNTLSTLKKHRPFNLPIASTPCEVIHRENKMQLKYYRSLKESGDSPVLIVPSLINRYYILDLLPGYSLVEYLVEKGHSVFLIDWGTPSDEDHFLDLHTYIFRYIHRCVSIVKKKTQGAVTLMGYCLGGNLVDIYAATQPSSGSDSLRGLINLTTPVDFENDGLLSHWTRAESFKAEYLAEAFGNIPWYLMQSAFQMLSPLGTLGKLRKLNRLKGQDEFLDRFFALEAWGNDNVSFAGKAFSELIHLFYKNNVFMSGESFLIGPQEVCLNDISCPVLNIYSETDGIVPQESARAFGKIGAKSEYTEYVAKGGHIGAIVGKRAQTEFWPFLDQWIRQKAPVTLN